MKELLDKIESYGFECEAGYLKDCVEWKYLSTMLEVMEGVPIEQDTSATQKVVDFEDRYSAFAALAKNLKND